jgi:hypothetical protein
MEGSIPTPKEVENKYWQRYVKKGDVQTALERVFAAVCEHPIDPRAQYIDIREVTAEAVQVTKERGVQTPLFYNRLPSNPKRIDPDEYVYHLVLNCRLPGWVIQRHLNDYQVRVVPKRDR